RGVCEVDGHGMLPDIEETHNIEKEDGKAVIHKEDGDVFLDVDSPGSMNMWGITAEFFEILKTGFDEFLEK
ncbi:nucleotidyltransferase, partial [Mediterraneibacter faecis]|nr:nucleotidyltransferase [Mediterraneibacter faecis]